MTITAVRTHLLEHRLEPRFESTSIRYERRSQVLVEVDCDDGTSGWGDSLGPARYKGGADIHGHMYLRHMYPSGRPGLPQVPQVPSGHAS